jgi:hypothetical protein
VAMTTCRVKIRKACTERAEYNVSYFVDGSGSIYTCARHLPYAIDKVLDTPPAHGNNVSVTRIGRRAK